MSPSPSVTMAMSARRISSGGAASGRSLLSTNLPENNYFDPACGFFLDLRMQAGDWGYGGGGSITLRSDGYPTVVTAASGVYAGFQARIPAAGQYVATFLGDGDLTVDFGGSHVSHTSNRYVFQLDGDADDRVAILITRSNVANPVRSLVIVPIAHEADYATVLIHESFAAAIAPFQVLRFMDTFRINDVGDPYNTTTSWASRITADYALQAGNKGPALEYVIEICNVNQSDLWLNIPEQATTNWIDNAATLCAANLDSPLKVYLEYGNELWNEAFDNGANAVALAVTAGFPNTFDSRFGYQAMMGRYARQQFVAAFGGATRVKHVLACQTGFDDRIDILLDYPSTIGIFTDGDFAYEHADYLATAPYISGERADSVGFGSASATSIISDMTTVDIPAVVSEVASNAAQASSRGLGFCSYECGQHLFFGDSGDTTIQNKIAEVNRHTNMYSCMGAYLDGIGAHYDGPICLYTLCGEYSPFGCWGWMEDLDNEIGANPRECPKMDAAIDWIAANPS